MPFIEGKLYKVKNKHVAKGQKLCIILPQNKQPMYFRQNIFMYIGINKIGHSLYEEFYSISDNKNICLGVMWSQTHMEEII